MATCLSVFFRWMLLPRAGLMADGVDRGVISYCRGRYRFFYNSSTTELDAVGVPYMGREFDGIDFVWRISFASAELEQAEN
jgi:hypothetical protein